MRHQETAPSTIMYQQHLSHVSDDGLCLGPGPQAVSIFHVYGEFLQSVSMACGFQLCLLCVCSQNQNHLYWPVPKKNPCLRSAVCMFHVDGCVFGLFTLSWHELNLNVPDFTCIRSPSACLMCAVVRMIQFTLDLTKQTETQLAS